MTPAPITTTPRLIIRGWRERDRAPFAAINQDPYVMRYLGPPLTRAQSDAAIEAQITLMTAGEPAFWAVEHKDTQQLIGCIGVKSVNFEARFTPSYEIGWRLARPYWGRGLATEGARSALEFTFENWEMPHIHSFTVHANKASQAVMEKIGMTRIKDGDFVHPKLAPDDPLSDHVLYVIARSG